MLRIRISSWELDNLAKKQPAIYEAIRAASSGEIEHSAEERAAGKASWKEYTAFVNDLNKLPVELLGHAQFERPMELKLLEPDGLRVSSASVKEAMQMNQVHLPGNELLCIDEVKVEEDYCTDLLQEELEKGWRIIACLPSAGKRRPDYILGRKKV